MAFLKPDVNLIFASTGDVISPPLAKIALGWVSEIPDFEFENWIQNRQDQFMAHINQLGVVAWDETTEYLSNKSYVQVANGDIYRALRTNTGQSPTISNSLDWKLAFDSSGTSYNKSESDTLFARRANNLSDLVSAGSARANLSVYSQSESDGRYLNESSNLSDLTNDSTARTNLDVYSRAEVDLKDSVFSRKGANLSDLTSATTARNNLVVYSKSEVYTRGESDGRYLNESSNLSDLTNDAAARSNLYVYSKGESNSLYLNESNNLSDLVSAGAARANLSVYSTTEADSRYLNESSNLSDLTSASTARANLGVYDSVYVDTLLTTKAAISGQVFNGSISAPNLSGTNTGDAALAVGVGQTWQSVSRGSNVNYTNTTGKPIAVSVYSDQSDVSSMGLYIDGRRICFTDVTQANFRNNVFGIVAPGSVYRVSAWNVGISSWSELR